MSHNIKQKDLEQIKKDTHPEGSYCSWFYDDSIFNSFKNFDKLFLNKIYGHLRMFQLFGLSIRKDLDKFGKIANWDFNISNQLGIAAGYAYANPNQKIFVNISDAASSCGNHYEAIKLIEDLNLNNILLLIEYNNKGSRSNKVRLDLDIYKDWELEYIIVNDYINYNIELNSKRKVIIFDTADLLKNSNLFTN